MPEQDPIRSFPNATVYATNPDVFYVPFVDTAQGRVGYAVRTNPPDNEQAETFIYFNPSGDDDGGGPDGKGEANVFVYIGGDNNPSLDTPRHYYALTEDLGLAPETPADPTDELGEIIDELKSAGRLAASDVDKAKFKVLAHRLEKWGRMADAPAQ